MSRSRTARDRSEAMHEDGTLVTPRVRTLGVAIGRRPATRPACAVTKTNPMKVYMHYMPWFETPATLGGTNWGYHWKIQQPQSEHRRRHRQAADRVALLSEDRALRVARCGRHRIPPAAHEAVGRRRRDDRLVRRAGHQRRHRQPAHQLQRASSTRSTTSGSDSAS